MKKLNVLWFIGIVVCLILIQTSSLAEEGSPTPPPQMEPTPTPTPSADLSKKEELNRQSATRVGPLASPPSNDDFEGAALISALPYQQTIDTTGAITAPDDPILVCGAEANSNTVWYRFTPSSPGLIEANTFGSNYDTVLAVFTGTRGALNPIVCNDDVGIIFQSQVLFEAGADQTYYVSVADYGSPGGGLSCLTVKLEPSGAIKTRVLEPGDNLIHGFAYYNGYLWASTRTYPARILKIDSDTLDYQRIVLSSGLNDGEDLIAAAGYIWVILYTYPARIIRVNPETLQWQVAITFGSSELSYGGSLEYAFGYLWAGGYDRKIAKINLSNLSYQVFSYPAVTYSSQFHALTSGGGYLWASAPYYPWDNTVVRINPNNPTEYATVYIDTPMADDIAYTAVHLYTGAEASPSFVYRFADNLAYNSAYAFDHGSYGIFAHNAEVWSAHIGSPGRTIAFNTDLEIQSIQDLPVGFNNANEIAFDPEGYMYVTAWESPAKIVKFDLGGGPSFRIPVIIVPGIAASWHWEILFDIDLPSESDWNWAFPGYPIAGESWIPLINDLEAAGYEEDRDYFIAFYDWRKDNNWQNEDGKVPREYLVETIDKARQAFEQQYPDLPPSAFKVNIVAHSLGGIVTRSYVESPNYRGDVAEVILLGSPHDGVVDAYYAWEGGEVSPRWDTISQLAMRAYLAYMRTRHGERDFYKVIHDHAKVMHNLLPVGYDYLLRLDQTPIDWETMAEVNDFLAYTAPSDNAAAAFSGKGVGLTTIAGTNLDTWEELVVDTEHGESPPLWLDGKPVATLSGDGDGTVLASSALIPGAEQMELANVWHVDLPRATNTILQILGIEETVSLAGAVTSGSTSQEILAVFAGLTVDVELRDEAGNLVGNYVTDPSGDFKIIVAPDLAPGSYELRILGEEAGDYYVSVEFYGVGITAQEEFEGQTTAGGEESYTLYYDPDAPDPLQLGPFRTYLPIIFKNH